MSSIFNRAKTLHKQEGLGALFKEGLAFLRIYERQMFYLSQTKIIKRDESNFLPNAKYFTFMSLTSTTQLREIISENFNLVENHAIINYRLKKGAVGSLIFVDKELVAMDWIAMTESAKATFNIYPYKVDFLNREACTGGAWTNPKFRGNGFFTYLLYKHEEFLREKGYDINKSLIETSNIASLKANEKFSPEHRLTGKAVFTTILGLHFWKETPG